MARRILLIEPNYKNKYPPMGLMKIATYYRRLGDDVRFFKGDLKDLAAEITMERLIRHINDTQSELPIRKYYSEVLNFIKLGNKTILLSISEFRKEENLDELNEDIHDLLREYHKKYRANDYYETFDIVCIATLFTFEWAITIDTIRFGKNLCKQGGRVFVGGIASTIVPNEIYKETGVHPIVGLIDKPGMLGDDNDLIVENQPLDYSILYEIDYEYSAADAYFAYMTRGCPNKCAFCAVPTLEPVFCNYTSIKNQVTFTRQNYGEKRHLLLLDNNVLASNCFEKIVDEIKEMGFAKGEKYSPEDEYEIAFRNLTKGIRYEDGTVGHNEKAYIRRIVNLYHQTLGKLNDNQSGKLYQLLEESDCLSVYTATKETIEKNDSEFREFFKKANSVKPLIRYVDFNQGIEGNLLTEERMKKLAEVSICPLRIAFDHIELEASYTKAIRLAAKHGITDLSNYLLYNYHDKPVDLYRRMKLNVELCCELSISIYSFPMKYHPVSDPAWFRNRDYLGEHWNRKFIRSVQAVLNATKGKIGKGKSFFEEAFGANEQEFERILWMPETFIIYRRKHDAVLRKKLSGKYADYNGEETNHANQWWEMWCNTDAKTLSRAKEIIAKNIFTHSTCNTGDAAVDALLAFYMTKREHSVRKASK